MKTLPDSFLAESSSSIIELCSTTELVKLDLPVKLKRYVNSKIKLSLH